MKYVSIIILLLSALTSQAVIASDLIMARSKLAFPEAMLALQGSIKDHGYTVARVQRIDIGLTGMGYKTDKYRVVFVGKQGEIKHLVEKYPQMIPYMPPKVSIFAEKGDTVIVTLNPQVFAKMINNPADQAIFDHWESDVYSVFEDFRKAE